MSVLGRGVARPGTQPPEVWTDPGRGRLRFLGSGNLSECPLLPPIPRLWNQAHGGPWGTRGQIERCGPESHIPDLHGSALGSGSLPPPSHSDM